MPENLELLEKSGLFEGVGRAGFSTMLACLGARTREYKRDETVLAAGEPVRHVGIVLSGRLNIVREGADGGRALIAAAVPGDYFAEALCCAAVWESPVSVIAETDAEVLWLEFNRILHTCPSACENHTTLIGNLLRALAEKNLQLQGRMELLEKKSIRERLLAYLETFARQRGAEFFIPFDREELADFLCVDRSALSRELGRMKKEGLLDFTKNRFTLK